MPLEFRFYGDSDDATTPSFRCQLRRMRCRGTTSRGRRCQRTVVIGIPHCAVHLLRECRLRIAPSRIPRAGLGLFASTSYRIKDPPVRSRECLVFRTGDWLAEYTGEILTAAQYDRRYGTKTGPYVVVDVDAACKRSTASLANHAAQTGAVFSCPPAKRSCPPDPQQRQHSQAQP